MLKRYEIPYDIYSILLYHPVTSEIDKINFQTNELIKATIDSNKIISLYTLITIYQNI